MDQAKSWINKQLKDLKTRLNYVNSVTNTNNVHDNNSDVNITVNEDAFLLPENQLQIEIKPRVFDEEVDDFKYQPQQPLYLSTCYDEYSRNYCTVNIGKSLTSSVDLIKLHDSTFKTKDEEIHSNKSDEFSLVSSQSPLCLPANNTSSSLVLQSYCPTLRDWYSTFRYQTTDTNLHLVSGKVNTDINLLIKLMKCAVRQKCFEPIYGSMAVYSMVDDDLHRITESFHFDATPKAIRQQYAGCYVNNKGVKMSRSSSRRDDFQGSCINVADGSGSQEHFHMFMATIPEDLKKRELYLVVQLSKVLSSDADKAVQPYLPRSTSSMPPAEAIAKHQQACERLSSYRQPIGIGVLRFTDDSGRISGSSSMSYKMETAADYNTMEMGVTFFCQRVILSDQQIGQMIRDLHPTDGTNPYTRMEPLDVDMRVMLVDMGSDEQMLHKLPVYQSRQLSMRYSTHVRSMKSPDDTYTDPSSSSSLPHSCSSPFFPLIIPSQIQSDGSQLVYQKDYSTLDHLEPSTVTTTSATTATTTTVVEDSKKAIVSFAVRQVMLLLPLPPSPTPATHSTTAATATATGVAVKLPVGSPGGPMDYHQITRTARTTVDNSLYVYPLQLDRFKNRNLVLKIQLVEFKKLLPYPALMSCPYTVLRSLYSSSCITGPIFSTEGFTRLSYHTKNPYLNDEFKLRLPDVLDGRHWLRFTVVHMHVKRTDQRGSSLLGSITMKASVEKEDRLYSEVGQGFLALMLNGEALLRDGEHVVNIYSTAGGEDGSSRSKKTADHLSKPPPPPSSHSHPPMGGSSSSSSGGIMEMSKLLEGQVRLRTRALSSLVSSDKRIQNLFNAMPVPYGALPSTIMSNSVATTLLVDGTTKPPVDLAVATATQELMKVPASAISKHFYVLMRQLIRTMVSGTGVFDPHCSSPYKHILSRSSAFLALLHVMGKIANDDTVSSFSKGAGSSSSSKEGGAVFCLSLGKQFLHAYVDFLFDEEVAVELMYDEDEKAAAEQIKADKRRSLQLEGSLFSPPMSSYSSLKDEEGEGGGGRGGGGGGGIVKALNSDFSSAENDDNSSDSPEHLSSQSTGTKPFSPYSAASNIDEEATTLSADASLSDHNHTMMMMASSRRGQAYVEAVGVPLPAVGVRVSLRSTSTVDHGVKDRSASNTHEEDNRCSSDDDDDNEEEEDLSIASTTASHSDHMATGGAVVVPKQLQGDSSDGLAAVELGFGNVLKKLASAYSIEEEDDAVTAVTMLDSNNNNNNAWNNDHDLEQSYDDLLPLEAYYDDINDPKMMMMRRRQSEPNYRRNSELTAVPILSPMEQTSHTVRFQQGGSERQKDGDDDDEDVMTTQQQQVFPDFLSPKEAKAAQRSDSRKSWGMFITDKLWISGQLEQFDVAVAHALNHRGNSNNNNNNNNNSNNATDSSLIDTAKGIISVKHIVDISNHVSLQAEKIVIEALLEQALNDICQEVKTIADTQSTTAAVAAAASGTMLPSEDQILMDAYFHIIKRVPKTDDAKSSWSTSRRGGGGGGRSKSRPFDTNRVWFSSVQRGEAVDPNDLLLLSPPPDDDASTLLLSAPTPTPPAVVVSQGHGQGKYRSRAGGESEIVIEPIAPNYDTLEGHRHRINRISDATDPAILRSTQWWPCLYEVLVFQWGAVLAVTLSALKLIKSENMRSMIDGYPFETLLKKQCAESNPLSSRSLLIEHCPILLKMVFKSLSLRISRELLRPPVYLDAQFMAALENLVMLLGVESASLYSGLNRARDMISSLAHFFRSLFALVCPLQVIKVIRSYFKATRKCRRVEEAELRLRMIEEIGWFDHFVAVNFPYTVDAPMWVIRSNPLVDAALLSSSSSMQLIAAYTTTGIRADTNPLPYTLCHVLIEEIIKSYKQVELKVRETSLEVLRDLLVRHAYDARYQSAPAQQRVACMYLPLLNEFLHEKTRLFGLRYDSSERREVLSIAMYLLHGLPECVLRDWIRSLFAVPEQVVVLSAEDDLISGATKDSGHNHHHNHHHQQGPHTSSFLSSYTSKTVLSLKSYKLLSNSSLKAYIPPIVCTQMPVVDLIMMLHMILDTFEMPRPVTALVTAHAQSMNMTQTSAAAAAAAIEESDNVSQVLAPRIILLGGNSSSSSGGGVDSQRITPAVRLTDGSSMGGATNSNANSGRALTFYNNLERRLQNKKSVGVGVSSKRPSTADPTTSASNNTNLSKETSGPDERPWVGHARKMAGIASGQTNNFKFDRYVIKDSINVATQKAAAECLCATASRIVINIVSILIEVCPALIPDSMGITGSITVSSEITDAFTFILRDSNVDESMLVGIDNLPLVYFKRLLTTVLLHGLHCNQQHDSSIVMFFDLASRIIQNFGAKVFFVAVEDSLQDWVRISFRHAASTAASVRVTACNFIIYLLRGSFHFFGSISLVSTTILAVINDVVDTILETAGSQVPPIRTHSDEDRALTGLDIAIDGMKATAQANISSSINQEVKAAAAAQRGRKQGGTAAANSALCKSIVDLMSSLQVILLAHSDLRRYTGHPIGFDFYGSNMLDGPWDQRNSDLMNAIRHRRKHITSDSGKPMPVLSSFQMEEIMVHLLRAADVYDCFKLPRFRMFWLENLAILHKRRAESAEIRWRIFKICENLGDAWRDCWSPRPPLSWNYRLSIHPDYQLKQMLQQTVPAVPSLNAMSNVKEMTITSSSITSTTTSLSRPAHEHSTVYGDRNFYKVLIGALDGRVFRPWEDYDQYVKHLEYTLDEAIKGYISSNLVHLAERTSYRLMHLYRLLKQPEKVLKEYSGISDSIRSVAEKGITASIAIGTFYRVLYEGLGAPSYLRGKEFIYRNANQVHVKEFQDQVILHLKGAVAEGVVVSILQSISVDTDLANNKAAYIIMNTVTKVMHRATKVSVRALNYQMKHTVKRDRPSSFPKIGEIETLEALNQVKTFQFSAPFTLGGKSHSKTINEQWLRTTTLHVDHFFPYVMTRQEVTRREVRIYSPIQVAILDIEERIDSMESELEKPANAPSDCNDLMRIIQGTVLPQVNAGVGEVAKVFLTIGSRSSSNSGARDRTSSDWYSKKSDESTTAAAATATAASAAASPSELKAVEDNNELTVKLKLVLIDFMSYSKLLIQKARKVLIEKTAVVEPSQSQSSFGSSLTIDRQQLDADAMQAQFNRDKLVMWQTEMEKGFDALMLSLLPYLNDLMDTDAFQPLR